MSVYHKTAREVLDWDDIQIAYFVNKAMEIGRWQWNFSPPEAGGKDESERAASRAKIDDATPQLLLPSKEKFEYLQNESESHGLTGPQV